MQGHYHDPFWSGEKGAGGYAKRIACWRAGDVAFEARWFDFVLGSSVLSVTAVKLFDASLREIARLLKPGGTLLLLEQVAPKRGLALPHYYHALLKQGFENVRAYPIRRLHRSSPRW